MTAIGIIAFVVALLVSVMLHEAGHFLFAKRFGMKATQFFVGFGPTLWSRRRGETEYGVKAIPAGGFVKIVGMTQLEEVDPADEPRAFYRQPAPRRAIVLAAGSIVHFVIALVLVFGTVVAVGTPVEQVGRISPCVPATVDASCPPGAAPTSPAALAGFRTGDKPVAVDGRKVADFTAFTKAVRAHGAGPVDVTVVRDGKRVTLRPVLVEVTRPALTGNGTERVGAVGVSARLATERTDPITGAGRAVTLLVTGVGRSLGALGSRFAHLGNLLSNHRDPEGLVGVVGAARISGETLGAQGLPFGVRLASFLLLVAGLNVFVGLFNLLPLLPLDGGHLAVLGFEQARSGIARALHRPAPGRVDLTKLMPAAYLVVALFIGLSVLILYADLVNPIKLNQ